MTWVRRTPPPDQGHKCEPPMRGELIHFPDGHGGDLWRCDHCGRLWQLGRYAGAWLPAGWWQRVRNRRHGYGTEDLAKTAELERAKED